MWHGTRFLQIREMARNHEFLQKRLDSRRSLQGCRKVLAEAWDLQRACDLTGCDRPDRPQ